MAIGRRILVGSAVIMVLGTQAALAGGSTGTIAGIEGKVLLGTGKGFAHARLKQPVRPGDRLLVSQGAAATLAFEGCTITLTPGAVHTVSALPCAAAEGGESRIIPTSAPANTLDTDLAQLERDHAQLHDLQKAVTRLRASAAADGNVVAQNCVDAKLVELKRFNKAFDTHLEAFKGNASEAALHHVKAMGAAAEKSRSLAEDAALCASDTTPDLRETTVTEVTEPSPVDTGLGGPPPPPPRPQLTIHFPKQAVFTTTSFAVGTGLVMALEVLPEDPVSVP